MRAISAALYSLFIVLIVSSAMGQGSLRIAAVVNEEIISAFDVSNRLRLALVSSRLPRDPAVQRRFQTQILRNLIDDSLRMQEARRLGIKVSDQEIRRAILQLESRNNVPRGKIDEFLASKGLDKLALIEQVKAQIVWAKLVNRKARESAQVSEQEIKESLELIEASKGKPEYLLNEIFLPFEAGTAQSEVKKAADRLFQQIKGGANFAGLARTFSQSATAASGGNLGWARIAQLDQALAAVLVKMKPGQISPPVKAVDGYYLLALRDQRIGGGILSGDLTVSLQQVFLPLAKTARSEEIETQMALARTIADSAENCSDMNRLSKELNASRSGRLDNVRIASLPPLLRSVVQSIDLHKASEPVRSSAGIVVVMVCERKGGLDDTQVRDRVRQSLRNQKMELVARRYIRNLRRTAFVEIRR